MPLPPSCDRRHLLQLGPPWNVQWRRRCSRKEARSSPTPGPSYLARAPLHHQGTSSRARKSSKRQPLRQPERIDNLTRMFEPAMSHMDGQESIDTTCALLNFPLQFSCLTNLSIGLLRNDCLKPSKSAEVMSCHTDPRRHFRCPPLSSWPMDSGMPCKLSCPPGILRQEPLCKIFSRMCLTDSCRRMQAVPFFLRCGPRLIVVGHPAVQDPLSCVMSGSLSNILRFILMASMQEHIDVIILYPYAFMLPALR